ncbi:MAG: hypothetical protein ACPF9D_00015 [Owenweeksia sp.]
MRSAQKYTLTLILLIILTFPAFSQPEDPDAPTPFGFVEILIGAGALYGGRKAHQMTRRK